MIIKSFFNLKTLLIVALLAHIPLAINGMDEESARKNRLDAIDTIVGRMAETFNTSPMNLQALFVGDLRALEILPEDIEYIKVEFMNDTLLTPLLKVLKDKNLQTKLPLVEKLLRTPMVQDSLYQQISALKIKQHELLILADVTELSVKVLRTKLTEEEKQLSSTKDPLEKETIKQNVNTIKSTINLASIAQKILEHSAHQAPLSPKISLWSSLSLSGKVGVCAVVGLAVYGTIEAVKQATQKKEPQKFAYVKN